MWKVRKMLTWVNKAEDSNFCWNLQNLKEFVATRKKMFSTDFCNKDISKFILFITIKILQCWMLCRMMFRAQSKIKLLFRLFFGLILHFLKWSLMRGWWGGGGRILSLVQGRAFGIWTNSFKGVLGVAENMGYPIFVFDCNCIIKIFKPYPSSPFYIKRNNKSCTGFQESK
jgi:hypothetical protein